MRSIYKYELDEKEQEISLPELYDPKRGCIVSPADQVIHVESQHDTIPCIWCLVDTERTARPVSVVTRMTGERFVEDGKRHVGSFQIAGGTFVGHVFM